MRAHSNSRIDSNSNTLSLLHLGARTSNKEQVDFIAGEMDYKQYLDDNSSTVITSLSIDDNTPSHTVITEDLLGDASDSQSSGVEAVPWADEKFIIRHRQTGQAIGVDDEGDVRLMFFDNVGTIPSCHWKCVEQDGWFGFKHLGRYLGHNNRGGIHAEWKHHKQHEWLCVRKHPEGGYQIMTLHSWKFRYVTLGKDGQGVVETKDANEAALWDFLKV